MDDETYFDNQDELSVEEQLLGEEGAEESESGRGDLNIALKKEREEKRLLKEELAQRNRELERREALLQSLGQRREEPKVDREAVREKMRDSLLDSPDEFLGQRDQYLLNHMQKMNAPIYVKAAKSDVADHPDYGDLYKSRPSFKKTVDAYITNQVNTRGAVDQDALNETLTYLAEIATEAAPAGNKPSNQTAKDKLSSVVDKGSQSGRQSFEQILEEKMTLAERGMKGDRKARDEYSKWESTPEGKAVLNKALKQGQL